MTYHRGCPIKILGFTSTAEKPSYTVTLTGTDNFTVKNADGKALGNGRSGTLFQSPGLTLLLQIQGKEGDSLKLKQLHFNGTVAGLRNKIRATEVGKKTNIIRIAYSSINPELSRDVVNAMVQAYLDQSIAFKTEEASRTVNFVEDQLKGIKDELNKSESDLQGYKSSVGMVRLDTEAEELIKKFSDMETERAMIGMQRKQLEFALASLNDSLSRGRTYSPAVMKEDPLVAGMASRLAELEVQKRALLVEYTRDHPSVKTVQGQIDEVQRKIQATYETGLKNITRQESDITRRLAGYEGNLRQLPAAERDLARYMRLAKVNADIYTFLLRKHEEARIAKASTISNINIVDPAITPDNPVKPQKKKNLLLGLLVGCMIGVGLAFFQEYLDDTIKDAEEAKRLLGWPVLAIIPCIPNTSKSKKSAHHLLISRWEPKSIVAESFRSLRSGIHFSSVNREKKLILVTSAFPGEGKTTIAANLAITLNQVGSKVLIIDCDLRRSSLHEKFDHSKSPGLTELVAGDVAFASCIHNTDIAGLDFISAGVTPPNPAELLGSESMANFVAEQRLHYDFIILDAPPTLAVTDAAMLTIMSDLVVLVLGAGDVPRKAAIRVREILAIRNG